jgi:hypothetical protein
MFADERRSPKVHANGFMSYLLSETVVVYEAGNASVVHRDGIKH